MPGRCAGIGLESGDSDGRPRATVQALQPASEHAASGRDTGWQHGEAEEVLEYRLYFPQLDSHPASGCQPDHRMFLPMLPDDVGWAYPLTLGCLLRGDGPVFPPSGQFCLPLRQRT